MKPVSELFKNRPNTLWSLGPDDSVFEAIKILAEKGVGALMVMDKGKLVGILSERDYARGVALRGRSSRDMEIGELMAAPVVVTPEDALQTCMERMTERRVRHLPVLENGVLIGIVTIGDLVKATMDEQALLIHELEGYIRGS